MQTSPVLFENTSYIFSNPTINHDEHQSYDTTIPFLDDTQRNSMSTKSCETLSRQQRTRNWSHFSEQPNPDNESTVTVNLEFF
jgi:hypothetical protein